MKRYHCKDEGVTSDDHVYKITTLTDETAGVKLSVCPEYGGEISSIQVLIDGKWEEIIHRANKFDNLGHRPKRESKISTEGSEANEQVAQATENVFWRGKAPWLFPAVGRSFLDEQIEEANKTGQVDEQCKWQDPGNSFETKQGEGRLVPRVIPIHGFIMNLPWALVRSGVSEEDAFVELTLDTTMPAVLEAAKLNGFPDRHFALNLQYVLQEGAVKVALTVKNLAGASRTNVVPFSIGNHITFNYPFVKSGSNSESENQFEEGVLRGNCVYKYNLSPLSLFDGSVEEYHDLATSGWKLSHPSSCNAILASTRPPTATDVTTSLSVTKEPSEGGSVERSKGKAYLELKQENVMSLRMEMDEAPYTVFVLWGSKEHSFHCVEPWAGLPNSLNNGMGRVLLQPEEQFQWHFSISFHRLSGGVSASS